jgi:predicted NAD/FAD-dependent oxidoreductase
MPADSDAPTLIVGAGVSGLACAQALAASGRKPVLLERARGVGGRCATRRLEGQPLDHGPVFLHGRDPEFLAALDSVPATRLPGWPVELSGAGQPCQASAFAPGEQRLAFAEGVAALPRHLAAGLDVRLEVEVTSVELTGAGLRVRTAAGGEHRSPVVVLALAAEQVVTLLAGMAQAPDVPLAIRSAQALLGLSRSQACLSVLALYPEGAPRPGWQVRYPEESQILQLLSHDSSKRPSPCRLALVLQARPSWSRAHLEDPGWTDALLAEAGRLLGPWAERPEVTHAHRWSFARGDLSAELAGPLLLRLPGGGRLGLCGDRFAPGAGVEAAWRSGRMLASRILAEGAGR